MLQFCYDKNSRQTLTNHRPEACSFIKKETLAQAFSCEFCEIYKNTFCYRTPLVAASGVLAQQTFVLMKTSWRCLEDVFRLEDVLKTSWRRLEHVWPRRIYWSWARRLEDVFWRHEAKANIFVLMKTFWRRSRHLQDVLQRYLQDVFKMYHEVKLFLLTRLWEAFNTFLRRSFPKTVIYRGICLSNTNSDKFMVSEPNLQER